MAVTFEITLVALDYGASFRVLEPQIIAWHDRKGFSGHLGAIEKDIEGSASSYDNLRMPVDIRHSEQNGKGYLRLERHGY